MMSRRAFSTEKRRRQRFIEPYQRKLQQSGVPEEMDFIGLLKKHSEKGNAPKGSSKDQRIITRKSLFDLVKFLNTKSNGQLEISYRDFNRIDQHKKNIMFTCLALECPDLMKLVPQNNFELLGASLYKKEELARKWINYVDHVQTMKFQMTTDVEELDINLDSNDDDDFVF